MSPVLQLPLAYASSSYASQMCDWKLFVYVTPRVLSLKANGGALVDKTLQLDKLLIYGWLFLADAGWKRLSYFRKLKLK